MVLFVLYIFMFVFVWGSGYLIFSGDFLIVMGLIMGVVILIGIMSLIWVVMYKGNVGLMLFIILVDIVLFFFIVLLSFFVLVGVNVQMDVWGMMKGFLEMVVFLFIVGMMVNQFFLLVRIQMISWMLFFFLKFCLMIVIVINSLEIVLYVMYLDIKFVGIVVVVFFIVMMGYVVVWLIGRFLKWSQDEIVFLIYMGGMCNISVGVVFVVLFFLL